MSTQNRRIATYLPSELYRHFKDYSGAHNLKDSQALIAILSEFFGVSQEVAQGSSNLLQRVEALENRVNSLKDELLDELKSELLRDSFVKKDEVKTELLSELKDELPKKDVAPGQLELISEGTRDGEMPYQNHDDDTASEEWLTTKECWEKLGEPGPYDTFRKRTGDRLKELYGVEFNSQRKEEKQYGKRWLKLPESKLGDSPVNQGESPI